MDNHPCMIGGMKMVVNKENMIDALDKMIDKESANIKDIRSDDINDTDVYLMGYVRALKNLKYAISVYGE